MTELSRRGAWAVAIVATLTMTVSYIDRVTFGVLAPTITKELDISEQAYGWLTSAFAFAYLFATPLSGWWIDRIGARRGLVGSVLLWSSVAAVHALIPGFGVLFALRIALGLAEGPGFPGAAQTIQRVLPAADRERGFGVLFTGSSVGAMIAPPLATALFAFSGWRFAFLGTALVGLIWVPLWLVVTGRPAARARLDAVPAATTAPRPRFVDLVRHPLMLRALIAIVGIAPTLGFLQAWGAKYLVATFGLQQVEVGHYMWMPPLMLDLGAIAFGDAASRQRRAPDESPRRLLAIAMLLALCFALVPFARTPWEAIALTGLAYAGGGGIYTLVTSDLLGRMPAGSVSFAGGILAGAQSLAHIIVGPIIGQTVATTGSYEAVTIALGLWVVPCCTVWLLWRPRPYA